MTFVVHVWTFLFGGALRTLAESTRSVALRTGRIGDVDRTEAVNELYGSALPDFVATRSRWVAAARSAGETELAAELAALRKPTLAAWLLNMVTRSEPRAVVELNALGERMRAAQAKGDGEGLARARPERREALDNLCAAARRCADEAGVAFAATAQDQVLATGVAALADADSGRALSSGQLLRPLSYAGFGEVELDDAVATPLRLVPPLPHDEGGPAPDEQHAEVDEAELARRAELAAAREELREAERDLGAARLAESQAREVLAAARERAAELAAAVARATAEVRRLRTRPGRRPAPKPPGSAGP